MNFSILLVLKNRSNYTVRLMHKWNLEKFPHKIWIADGGNDSHIEALLLNKENFKNLEYEYIRYPFDSTLEDFYKKMASAVMKIDTDTTLLMDNDDFIDVDGINKCVEILNDHSYCSARGLMQDMQGNNMYSLYPDSIIESSAAERVVEQTKRFHSNWHNVARTKYIQAMWKIIEIANPQYFRVVEQATSYLNTVFGNSYRGNFSWMHHEYSERIQTQSGSLGDHFPDQRTWIESSHDPKLWLEEFNKLTEMIGAAISYHDQIPIEEGLKIFRECYHLKLPDLKDLLDTRISQAFDLGYNYNKIDQMLQIMTDLNIEKAEK